MGFLSYSVDFFKKKLNFYESVDKNKVPISVVHEARVLLKLLDDIRDEGYVDSYTYINDLCDAVNRLNSFIVANNEKPFVLNKNTISQNIKYEEREYDLESYIGLIEQRMKSSELKFDASPDIFYDILAYSKSIFKSSNSETAYCFLLRDALLPYLAFKKWDCKQDLNIVPLFISRKFFSFFEKNKEELYTSAQNMIFDALDNNVQTFEQLKQYIRNTLNKTSGSLTLVVDLIRQMLAVIPQKNIMVIESGYIGTIPVLLSAIDDRVDFRMFTTVPYFYKLYKEKIFTKNFEKIRLFETIQCQDALFKLSSIYDNGRIMISETSDNKVKNIAYRELCLWNSLISNGANTYDCKH